MLELIGLVAGLLIGAFFPWTIPAQWSLYVAAGLLAALVFGTRMFQNFAEIRRELLTSKQKRAKISQDIVRDGEDGTK